MAAITAGGSLETLVAGLRAAEQRKTAVVAERRAIEAPRVASRDVGRIKSEILALAAQWRIVLTKEPEHARPILSQLLVGRATYTPLEQRGRWTLTGEGTLAGLFARDLIGRDGVPNGLSSVYREPVLTGGSRRAGGAFL
jgi:type III secretion system FlhB-like substrate exporter